MSSRGRNEGKVATSRDAAGGRPVPNAERSRSAWRWPARVASALLATTLLAAALCALWPVLDRYAARVEARRVLAELAADGSWALRAAPGDGAVATDPDLALVPMPRREPVLASWGSIGGCGVSGGASATSGVKWVGRGVSGGLVDLQCIGSYTLLEGGGRQATLNTRIATGNLQKWTLGATVPFRYNVQDIVDWQEVNRTARLPGWGDIGLEATRKLGIANSSTLTVAFALPTGASGAVRHGVRLPQQMQLGNGVVSGGLTYEYTEDRDWGPCILGANAFYGGGENEIGDRRSSSASGYAHAGYVVGPWVPSVGLTLTAKRHRDLQRGSAVGPRAFGTFHLALEWSNDWVATLLSGSVPVSASGVESWGLALGLETNFF